MKLNYEQILDLIPHRPPFLFIDDCEIIEDGKKGIASRVFKSDEYFFKGHFPGNPIVPGVIIVEALAQTAGVVVSKTFDDSKNKSVLFTSISSSKFRKPVYPNDEISFEVEIQNKFKSVYKFCGIAKNTSNIVCEASFSAMIVDKSSEEIL